VQSGSVNLDVDATLEFVDAVEIDGGVFNVAADAAILFQGDTELSGGNFSTTGTGAVDLNGATDYAGGSIWVSNGVVYQNGDATVSAPTTISGDDASWDIDGRNGDTVWNLNSNLTIYVSRLEAAAAVHRFDGRINLNGSGTTMTVNTDADWTMGGRLDIDDGAVLAGSRQMNVTGTINAESGRIAAPVAFKSGAAVTIGASDTLELAGVTDYEGGAYRGGTIRQNGTANVTADTTLGTNLYQMGPLLGQPPTTFWLEQFDWDGTAGASAVTNISPGVTFTINAVQIEGSTSNGYGGTVNVNGGTLLVNTGTRTVPPAPPNASGHPIFVATPWRLDVTMNLQQVGGNNAVVASQYASPLHIYGEVNALGGNAALGGMPILLTPEGDINVSNGATLSLGLSAEGRMNVQPGGLLRLNASSTLHSSVQATINGTAELTSASTFQGGTYQGSGTLRLQGNANFAQTTTLGVNTEFVAGGTTTIPAGQELRLANDAQIHLGAAFQGDGTLRNLEGSDASLLDGAEVSGVHVINDGDGNLGSSPGTAIVEQFTQTATGRLFIEIGGTAMGEFDKLIVNGQAQLGGALDVSFIELTPGGGVFTPAPGDSFDFLSAGSIVGAFSNVTFDSRLNTSDGMGSFYVDFDPLSGTLTLADFEMTTLSGDFDLDGDVDGRDFLVWQRGESPNPLSAGDLVDWRANFGSAQLNVADAAVPEPGMSRLVLAALLGIVLQVRSSPNRALER
jgi:hypothetical protein